MIELPYTPFVVACAGRDGSTWLGDMLAGHHEIRWGGEILHLNSLNDEYRGFPDARSLLTKFTFNPESAECRAAGLKYVPWMDGSVYPEVADGLDFLRSLSGLKVIFLRRDNLLRQFLSKRLAAQTGVYGVRSDKEDRYTRPQIEIDVETLHDNLLKMAVDYAQLVVEFHGFPSLGVTYESLKQNLTGEFSRICRFLGISVEAPITPQLRVQERRTLPQIIKNYDEVSAVLKGTRWDHMLRD